MAIKKPVVEAVTAVATRSVRTPSTLKRAISRPIDLLDSTVSVLENSLGATNDVLIMVRQQIQIQMIQDEIELEQTLLGQGIEPERATAYIQSLPQRVN